jgi:hypothetical protein
MKKVIKSRSATLQEHVPKWVFYWQAKGYEVIDKPGKIDKDDFDKEYPVVYKKFYNNLLKADLIFIMNEDKDGIVGYIGAGAFAELNFIVANNQIGKTNAEIILCKMPSKEVFGYVEVNNWLKYNWIKVL